MYLQEDGLSYGPNKPMAPLDWSGGDSSPTTLSAPTTLAASNTQLAGNMGVAPTAGEAVGTLAAPLISDETVNRLVEFGSMFAADGPVHQIFNGFVGQLESVVSSISKIPTSITLTLQTPRVEVIVNANNMSSQIAAVVEGLIFKEIGSKFEDLSARMTNLENRNRPDGAGNSLGDVGGLS
jgi:hypothetical protein